MRYNKKSSKDALGCKARSVFAFCIFIGNKKKTRAPRGSANSEGWVLPAGLCKRDALFFSFFTGGAKAERSA